MNAGILQAGRGDDRIICEGLRQELAKNELYPDSRTFYLLECGLPHLPALASVLLDYEIDPSIYIEPSPETINKYLGHFTRYQLTYQEHAKAILNKRQRLGNPKGLALLVNSHAEADELRAIVKILPSVEFLRQMGISRIVLGKEAFYHNGAFRLEELTDQTFLAASEINQYAKQLSEAGFEVVVIGFDYRYKDPAQNAKTPIRNLFESKSIQKPDLSYPPMSIKFDK